MPLIYQAERPNFWRSASREAPALKLLLYLLIHHLTQLS